MSGLVNKVKEALSGDHHDKTTSQPEGTSGPHNSRVANAADPRIDSDRDGSRTAGTGTYSTTGNYSTGSGPAPNTAGPHKSDALNKADPRVDSDRDGSKTAGNTGTTTGSGGAFFSGGNTSTSRSGAPEGTYGHHNSRLANAADPRVDSDRDGSRTAGGNTGAYTSGTTGGLGSSGAPEGTYGTHNSRLANAADPRIDSDRDGSRTAGNTGGLPTHTGTHHTTRTTGSGAPEGTYGTHNSRLANAADPRIDSDRDGSRTAGTGTGAYSSGTTGGLGSGPASHTAGPHKSDALNKLDPRVDSDRDGSNTVGNTGSGSRTAGGLGSEAHNFGTTGPHGTHTAGYSENTRTGGLGSSGYGENTRAGGLGSSGYGENTRTGGLGSSGAPEGTYGHHNSRLANAADPRVDSDRDGSRTAGGNTGYNTRSTGLGSGTTGTHTGRSEYGTGPGPAPNTAGPHKSDALNKIDPRVDSDLDGSKTMGREKTYDQQNTSFAGRDPTDATQVPPSVMQKAIGEPVVAHDNPDHEHQKRHSVSHQEQHRGL